MQIQAGRTEGQSLAAEVQVGSGARGIRKRRAILAAATEAFLKAGFLGASMDEVAAASSVSKQTIYKHFGSKEALFVAVVTSLTNAATKQTIYKHFGSKEALFVAVVTSLTNAASDLVHGDVPEPEAADDVAAYLRDYGLRQLNVVLTPRLLQLRRMVIGESSRFPELGKALYDSGPGRAMRAIALALERLAQRGFLTLDDPAVAAAHFNWLVMGDPVNAAMLLGDEAVPNPTALRRHVIEAVRVFLAAYAAGDARR